MGWKVLKACAAGLLLLASAGQASALTVYTAVGATTAQAPLWGAISDGWSRNEAVEVRFWKDLDDLRGVILAGKGDIWVGHLDGLAQAARQGAPITLIALTAWSDKFRFLTLDPAIDSPAALAADAARNGESLAVAPKGSPAVALLEAVRAGNGPAFRISDQPPQQIGLDLGRGAIRHVEVPEPLATALAAKVPALRDIGGLSALFKPANDKGFGVPMAGIAVRRALLTREPERIAALVAAMVGWAEKHRNDPDGVAAVLPAQTLESLGRDIVTESLKRDPTAVVDAKEAHALVEETLRLLDGPHPPAEGFLPR